MARRRQRIGPDLDVVRLGRGLAIPGGDLRHWVSYATVAAVDDDGEMDLSNKDAVVITPAGVDVDVVLEPSGYPCTAKHGIAAGTVFICGPIQVGDLVVVGIPDGDVAMIPRILAVVSGPNGAADVVPVGDDKLPVFKNDRLLIYAKGVPIDLRSTDGEHTSSLLANPDGSVVINGGSKGVARVGDPIKTIVGTSDVAALAASMVGAGLVPAGTGGPPPVPVPLANADKSGTNEIASGSDTVKAG